MVTAGITVVIPNYNGEKLLLANLPSVFAALDHWGGVHEVIVVDDCSTDGSCRLLAEKFPWVKVLVNTENSGFSKTCNKGMSCAKYPVALCINNDVNVEIGLIAPLLEQYRDEDVFAVTPIILAEREGRNQGVVIGQYGKGFLKGGFAPLEERHELRENLYAIGACVAYDLAKFRALGGYAEIYTPYLFEDVDISYRAWKRGWKSLFVPGARAHHYSSATISKVKKRVKRTIYFRNRFLFHWINLTDPSFIVKNAFFTMLRLSVCFLWLDFTYYSAFISALAQRREVAAMRKSVVAHLRLSDAEILRRTRAQGS